MSNWIVNILFALAYIFIGYKIGRKRDKNKFPQIPCPNCASLDGFKVQCPYCKVVHSFHQIHARVVVDEED